MSNWLGIDTRRVETRSVKLEPGDRALLCTDGLSNMVPDDEIAAILDANPDPQAAVMALIASANEAGGPDNISAVVVNVDARSKPDVLD